MLVEGSGIDWERDGGDGTRTDIIRAFDLLIRTGLDARTEVQLGWSPYGQIRVRDRIGGAVATSRGVGDVRLGLRRNLLGNDADKLSVAVETFATLPVGSNGLGDGDWSAGLLLPVAYPLATDWTLGFTGEVVAAVDEDGDGRHPAYAGTIGIGRSLADVTLVTEIALRREDDPGDAHTQASAAVSAAWQPRDRLQLDALVAAGLNHATPDLHIAIGGAILF